MFLHILRSALHTTASAELPPSTAGPLLLLKIPLVLAALGLGLGRAEDEWPLETSLAHLARLPALCYSAHAALYGDSQRYT